MRNMHIGVFATGNLKTRLLIKVDGMRLRRKQIVLSAQTHAIHFYQQAGFQITSDEYTDVHIPHVDMCLKLD